MRSNAGRALLGAALLIAAVVLFLVLQDDGGSDAPATGGGDTKAKTQGKADTGGEPPKSRKSLLPKIEIRDGKPVGGVETLEFAAGERIEFAVDSNVADEIHVHGYDVEEEVGAGRTARFDFPATIEGVFEVELHHSGEQIAELRVNP